MAEKKSIGKLDWELGLGAFDLTKEKYPIMNTCPHCGNKWIFYGYETKDNTIICPKCGKSELFFRSNFSFVRTDSAPDNLKEEFIRLFKEKQ